MFSCNKDTIKTKKGKRVLLEYLGILKNSYGICKNIMIGLGISPGHNSRLGDCSKPSAGLVEWRHETGGSLSVGLLTGCYLGRNSKANGSYHRVKGLPWLVFP